MVKNNSPIPRQTFSVDYNDKDFFDQVLSSDKFIFMMAWASGRR
jgi:hypothetical protein